MRYKREQLEQRSGLDFFSFRNDEAEAALESTSQKFKKQSPHFRAISLAALRVNFGLLLLQSWKQS
jgi:hypothetical protein